MNIALTDDLVKTLARQATQRGYATVEEYLRELLDVDAAYMAERRLDDALRVGLASGPPIEATESFWEEHKRRFLANHPEAAASL